MTNVILTLHENSDLQIKVVIQPEGTQPIKGADMDAAVPAAGVMVNSGRLTGTSGDQAFKKAIQFVEQMGVGKASTNYRLRDWLISTAALLGSAHPDRILRKLRYCTRTG